MLTVASLAPEALHARLAGAGLRLRTGRFTVRLQADLPSVTAGIALLYGGYPLLQDDDFAEFHLKLARPRSARRWLRPQVRLACDGYEMFQPMPLQHAFPMFEWGFNWCVSSRAHRYLMVHAAVLERNGRAVILPAPPGSGKSTLTAALSGKGGWRLLSDELTLLELDSGLLVPNPRPISLKNASIDIIRRYVPDAVLSTPVQDTLKGTVAHMRAPGDCVARAAETALPAWIVFPHYQAGAATTLEALPRAATFMELAGNSFNYSVLGAAGFAALGDLVERAAGFRFRYSALDEALDTFARLDAFAA
ncbi:HprK-related kinase A [Pseudoduganella violaceinigra]|uniref:HprK-related kinase A n=1 Tax=Pseudoduganella violaceinigra TaxID=246602 RepID=UPI0004136CD5|nr:HprK-related kinase A [Pseudoduganella violaceinigra]